MGRRAADDKAAAAAADSEREEQQEEEEHPTAEEEEDEDEDDEQQAPATAGKDVAAPSPHAGGGVKQDGTGLLLPLARVRKMMKETADVKVVATEASWVVARAAELFLSELAGRSAGALAADGSRKALDYRDVASVVNSWDAVDFLRSVVPQKVRLSDVMEQLQKQHDARQPRVLNNDAGDE